MYKVYCLAYDLVRKGGVSYRLYSQSQVDLNIGEFSLNLFTLL